MDQSLPKRAAQQLIAGIQFAMEECDLLIALLRISHDLATRHRQVVCLRAELARQSRPTAQPAIEMAKAISRGR
jgi:hypothetical protein